MPDELVQQTAVYGIEPLEFNAIQLDFPSISPFLGDTWWLETMDWSGAPVPGSSGLQVGTPVPGSSGAQVGTPLPGSSGMEVGTPLPGSSGIEVGKVYPKPKLEDDEAFEIDPATYGTSGREVGKVDPKDADFEQFFSDYPVILMSVDGQLQTYMNLHLLSLPDYRSDPNFIDSARQMSKTAARSTPWFTAWFFSRPNILKGQFSSPPVYVGSNVAPQIPATIKQEQRKRDAAEGTCPSNPDEYSWNCTYAGFYWANDELEKLVNRTRWIWQQWQPDWNYFAVDVANMLYQGGHLPTNLPNFSTLSTEGGFPPTPWDTSRPRSWSDPEYNPILGYHSLLDRQLNIPIETHAANPPILFRNYTGYSLPVYSSADLENPVMRIKAWVWNKSPIRALVY